MDPLEGVGVALRDPTCSPVEATVPAMPAYDVGAGCAADFNGDGMLSILGFVCFQGDFVAGCE